ncbi:MAG TPA: inositol monophosphatase family protein [Spirochaetota bacterium]|nr:inositol monophosphatase family protein [Spirochaetota bacterium]
MNDIAHEVEVILRGAGEILHEGYLAEAGSWTNKGRVDLVTEWDMKSERYIRETISNRFPGHAILGEEGGGALSSEGYLWVVDPLDGTTNFVHKLPYFSVAVACLKDGVPLAGGVFAPVFNKLFLAERGQGAVCNQQKIRVSSVDTLEEALFVTGFPYEREGRIPMLQRMIGNALGHVQGIRRMGSAALDLCHVASGLFDVYIEFEIKPWDMAAGVLVLEEAGGKVSRCDGSPLLLDGRQIVASNGILHDPALRNILDGVL